MPAHGEADFQNLSTPSNHRFPTISGVDAIRNAKRYSVPILTGLDSLDRVFGSVTTSAINPAGGSVVSGGRRTHSLRGHVTEVFGPPGVGRTTFALQVAANSIARGHGSRVTWIDTSTPLIQSRLNDIMIGVREQLISNKDSAHLQDQNKHQEDWTQRFDYVQITSLPHLLALFLHPDASSFPAPGTDLIVLEDISQLIQASLPRAVKSSAAITSQITLTQIRSNHAVKQANSRRFQTMSSLASSLQSLAMTRNMAILMTCKAGISMNYGQEAMLRPALTSPQWDSCLGTRIAVFRDFWPKETRTTSDEDEKSYVPTHYERKSLRFAQIVRLNGTSVATQEVGFVIQKGGLHEVISSLSPNQSSLIRDVTPAVPDLHDVFEDKWVATPADHHAHQSGADDNELDVTVIDKALTMSQKRKAIDISDDEAESEASLPTSSESVREEENDPDRSTIIPRDEKPSQGDEPPIFQTAKKLRMDDEQYAEAMSFSQAAAEVSDPLTPSDDGGQSS